MAEIDDGGAAFPCHTNPRPGTLNDAPQGMTLRDFFAAKALAAMIAQPGKDPENCGKKAVPRLAMFAYEYADAMIAARGAQ
jgi:hypothetical protein